VIQPTSSLMSPSLPPPMAELRPFAERLFLYTAFNRGV
jgi:hypothetical protein